MNAFESQVASMDCPKCNAANPMSAVFCGVCGSPLQGMAPSPPPPPPPPPYDPRAMLGSPSAGQVTVNSDQRTAFNIAVQAIRTAGGEVQAQTAPHNMKFLMTKRHLLATGGLKARYSGELVLLPAGPRQSALQAVIKLQPSSLTPQIALAAFTALIGALLLGGIIGLLLGAGCGAWTIWNASSNVPRELSDKLLTAISQAPIPAASVAAPPAQTAPQSSIRTQSGAVIADQPSTGVMDQIKQLVELHTVGALTNEEFDVKKAELLARL